MRSHHTLVHPGRVESSPDDLDPLPLSTSPCLIVPSSPPRPPRLCCSPERVSLGLCSCVGTCACTVACAHPLARVGPRSVPPVLPCSAFCGPPCRPRSSACRPQLLPRILGRSRRSFVALAVVACVPPGRVVSRSQSQGRLQSRDVSVPPSERGEPASERASERSERGECGEV